MEMACLMSNLCLSTCGNRNGAEMAEPDLGPDKTGETGEFVCRRSAGG
jgi:hypothetical protein